MKTRISTTLLALFIASCYDGVTAGRGNDEPAADRNEAAQLGRLTSVGNDAYRQWFDYDALGRVVNLWWSFDDRVYTSAFTYGWATRGAKDGELGGVELGHSFPHRVGATGEAVRYGYDRTGVRRQVTAVRPDGSQQAVVARIDTNVRGQATKLAYGACADAACTKRLVTERSYDSKTLRLTNNLTRRDDEVLQSFGLAFDDNGNTLRLDDHRNESGAPCRPGSAGCGASAYSATYDYDSLERVASATSGGATMRHGYDGRGNLTSKAVGGASGRVEQRYGGPGRGPHALAKAGAAELHYDATGNLVRTTGRDAGDVTLVFNADNVAVRTTTSTGTSSRHWLGTQMWKKVEGDTTTYYLPGVRIESAGGDDEVIHHYGAVAERDASGRLYFHARDPLGNTGLVTDEQGTAVRRLAYWTWGEERADLGTDEDFDPRRRFGDKELELDTGFVDFGPRLYLPDFGRFASADPMVADGPNRYAYARNNPLRYSDPSGFTAQDNQQEPVLRIESRCSDDPECLAGLIRDAADEAAGRRGPRRTAPQVPSPFTRDNAFGLLGDYDNADKYFGVVQGVAGPAGQILDSRSFRMNPHHRLPNGFILPLDEGTTATKIGGQTVHYAPTFSPRMYRAGKVLESVADFGGKALPIVGGAVDIGLAYGVVSDPTTTERQKHLAVFSAGFEIGLGFVPYVGFAAPFISPYLAEFALWQSDQNVKFAQTLVPGDDDASRAERARILLSGPYN